jgi:transposase
MLRSIMLHVDCARWDQTPEDLRRLATDAPHPRTRERFLALYEITQASCATRVASQTHRHSQTVMEWVHTYNQRGPAALSYHRTGGRPPFARTSQPNWMSSSVPPGRQPLHPR